MKFTFFNLLNSLEEAFYACEDTIWFKVPNVSHPEFTWMEKFESIAKAAYAKTQIGCWD